MIKYVVEIYTMGVSHPITRLEGPFQVKEFALKHARKMTQKHGLAVVRAVHSIEPKENTQNE